ncbi:MAG: hypothetical protein ABI550_04040 [Ignavibacteriaceae bacterium]
MFKKTIFSAVFILTFCISNLFAQTPPPEQSNLQQFAGKWVDKNAKVIIDGKTYRGEYSFESIPVNMNTGILAHERFTNSELGNLAGENLFGFDPNLGLVHLYSTDNTGTCHDHYGYWINDKHLFVQYQGIVEDKMYVEQIDVMFESPNKMVLNLNAMLNGKIYEKAEGTFLKQ